MDTLCCVILPLALAVGLLLMTLIVVTARHNDCAAEAPRKLHQRGPFHVIRAGHWFVLLMDAPADDPQCYGQFATLRTARDECDAHYERWLRSHWEEHRFPS